jgi:hypothetical protein
VNKLLAALLLIFVTASTNLASAKTPDFSDCLLPRSMWNIVSLGAPLAPERLGNKSVVRLGVIPFSLSDRPSSGFSEVERSNYLQGASNIEKLSNGGVKVELVFFPTITTKLRFQDASRMVQQRDVGWANWDLSKSTYGIAKEVIKDADPLIDFSNIDGVILENKSQSFGSVAEAFQFFRKQPDLEIIKSGVSAGKDFSFHQSINTQESIIDNAVLFDSHKGTEIIVHEILHNFGLTDLYGGNASTPLTYSAMASNTTQLLNYERAVLGWLPLDRIKCFSFADLSNQSLATNEFTIETPERDQLIVLKINDKEANILEVRYEFIVPSLILYELKQDERPPITVMSTRNGMGQRINLSDPASIGNSLKSNNLHVMISNMKSGVVTLNVIPNVKIDTEEFRALQTQALLNQEKALALVKAEAEKRASAAKSSKKTIVCEKGKKKVTVTAKTPKCPVGFKTK